MREVLVALSSAGLWLVAALPWNGAAHANVQLPGGVPPDAITVCSSGCDYTSIQDAVDAAEPGGTIFLGPETFYENIVANKDLAILGVGPGRTIIDGQRSDRVIDNHGGLTLTGVTIQNGRTYDGIGGGIANQRGARLNLEDCVVQDNRAYSHGGSFGGGILSSGDAVITRTLITGNTAQSEMIFSAGGGVIAVGLGSVAITTSTIVGNEADFGGGAAVWYGSGLTIEETLVADNRAGVGGGVAGFGWKSSDVIRDSAILGNKARYGGGGLYLPGNFRIENTTISGNVASVYGGGILLHRYNIDFWERRIENSTIAFNFPDGLGVEVSKESRLYNSIVADNAGPQCSGGPGHIVSEGNNLSSDTSCPFVMPGDIQGTDPSLLPLGDYGGPTPTHALHPDSLAIDAGGAACLPTDQRGVPRPCDGDRDGIPLCDIGAFEFGVRGSVEIVGALNDLIFQMQGADYDLVAYLQRALALLGDAAPANEADAVRALLSFIEEVESRRGFTIDERDAGALIEAAWDIVAGLYGRRSS